MLCRELCQLNVVNSSLKTPLRLLYITPTECRREEAALLTALVKRICGENAFVWNGWYRTVSRPTLTLDFLTSCSPEAVVVLAQSCIL